MWPPRMMWYTEILAKQAPSTSVRSVWLLRLLIVSPTNSFCDTIILLYTDNLKRIYRSTKMTRHDVASYDCCACRYWIMIIIIVYITYKFDIKHGKRENFNKKQYRKHTKTYYYQLYMTTHCRLSLYERRGHNGYWLRVEATNHY